MIVETEPKRELLRHALATLAYRGAKALRGAPSGFGAFRVGERTRTPVEILAHIGDLLDWALWLSKGQHVWKDTPPQSWDHEVERFFAGLQALERYLGSGEELKTSPEKLFQGPVADALTHVGQIGLLRGLAGAPVRGESYLKADISVGSVGPDQPPPRAEF
jgi:hypothetical protein